MAKLGRPKIPAKLRRAKYLTVRLTTDEHKSLKARAKEEHTCLATWARRLLVNHKLCDQVLRNNPRYSR